MAQVFERKALYDEVWSTPLTKLGSKYGLSDNGIRKICKELSIPLPEAGHWARVAAGQAVTPSPLPSHNGRERFVSHAIPNQEQRSEYAMPEDEQWLAERMAFESSSSGAMKIPSTEAHWHPAIAPLHHLMASAVKRHQADIQERDKHLARRARMKKPSFDWEQYRWRDLDEGLLYAPRGPRTCLRVSIHTYQRALALLNTLAEAASLRGCGVEVDNNRGAVRFMLEGAVIGVAIRERRKTIEPTMNLGSTPSLPAVERRLALVGSTHPGVEFQLVDGKKSLEEQLGLFFPRLYRAAVTAREEERKKAADKFRSERYWAEAAVIAAQREALEAERKALIEREQQLLREAADWRHAAEIREYVEAVCSAQKNADIADWKVWALTVADKLDPLQNPENTFRLRR